jgi:hypothetical protein
MGLEGAIGSKEVLVRKDGKSLLEAGNWVVLATAGRKTYELTSRRNLPDAADRDGTYVDTSVYKEIGDDVDNPTLRLYNRADVVKKVRTSAGLFLVASTLLAIATAGLGLWFEFAGDSGPSASATAAKARRLLAWATEPELRIDPSASPAAIAAARNELDQRQRNANECLERLRGGSSGTPDAVGGVACKTSSPGFWHDKDNAALLAGILGISAALLAGAGSVKQFSAGRSPDK